MNSILLRIRVEASEAAQHDGRAMFKRTTGRWIEQWRVHLEGRRRDNEEEWTSSGEALIVRAKRVIAGASLSCLSTRHDEDARPFSAQRSAPEDAEPAPKALPRIQSLTALIRPRHPDPAQRS